MHGKITDNESILYDGVALPTGTGSEVEVVSTAVLVGGRCELCLDAKTALAVATAKTFSIELLKGTTALNCTSPSQDADMKTFLVKKTSTEGAIAIAAGGEIIPPINLGDDWTGKYVQLQMSSDEDLHAQTIDAFLRPI